MNNRTNTKSIFFFFLLLLFVSTTGSIAAQTDPEETAVPYPNPAVTETPASVEAYPDNVQQPTLTPANPTPYPVFTATPVTTVTLPIVGEESALETTQTTINEAPTSTYSTSELIQSNFVLWVGFLIGLFMLGVGIYGAIILYARK